MILTIRSFGNVERGSGNNKGNGECGMVVHHREEALLAGITLVTRAARRKGARSQVRESWSDGRELPGDRGRESWRQHRSARLQCHVPMKLPLVRLINRIGEELTWRTIHSGSRQDNRRVHGAAGRSHVPPYEGGHGVWNNCGRSAEEHRLGRQIDHRRPLKVVETVQQGGPRG